MFRLFCMSLLVIILLAVSSSWLWAGEHVVRIEKELASPSQEAEFNATVRNEGFARAVLQEVHSVLGSSLAKARREAVLKILAPRVQEFVLSFSEQTFIEKKSKAVLRLNVRVNAQAVKSFLQHWGTYYTGSQTWSYVLRAPGLDPEALQELRTLELMSGVSRAEKAEPVLELKAAEGSWSGELRFQERSWKDKAESLEELWVSLWSKYFGLPGIRSRVQVGLELRVSGWSTFTGLTDFNRRMESWTQLLDRAKLQEAVFQGQGVSGRWLLRTLHQEALEKELQSFLSPRGLTFSLTRSQGARKVQAANATRSEESGL